MLKLALALGMSIRQVEAMDSGEISEWLAYDRIDPLPDPNLTGAMICATTANSMRSGKGRAYTPADFLPSRKQPARRGQSAAEGLSRMHAFTAAMKARG